MKKYIDKLAIFVMAVISSCGICSITHAQQFLASPPNFLPGGSFIDVRLQQLKAPAGGQPIESTKRIGAGTLPKTAVKATVIDSTSRFYIYSLPLDNMFCLVPDRSFNSSMPTQKELYIEGAGPAFNNNMPNPFIKEELISAGLPLHAPLPE